MPGPRDLTRTLERRALIAKRYLQGALQSVIAAELNITQGCVSKALASLREDWLAEGIEDYAATKHAQLLKVDLVEVEAWAAWEKSKLDAETTVQEKNNGRTKVSRKLEGQAGDPRYLDMVLKCVSQRVALLGLAAPQRFKIDFDALTEEQLVRLANGEPPERVLNQPTPGPLAEA